MAPGTTMPRFGAIELFWPRGSACVRYSENYLTQEVDERGSLSMLSGCATRGFFSVLATIRLKSTPFPLLLMQYVPSPSAKLARLDVNWQTIKKKDRYLTKNVQQWYFKRTRKVTHVKLFTFTILWKLN